MTPFDFLSGLAFLLFVQGVLLFHILKIIANTVDRRDP